MKRKQIMTIPEFMEYSRKSEMERKMELVQKHLNNKKVQVVLVASLAFALCMLNSQNAYAGTPDLSGIDVLGNTFLMLVRRIGRWICIVMGLISAIKAGLKGGDIIKDCSKYALIYAVLYIFPWILDVIGEAFGG